MWEKNIEDRGDGMCKGPGAGMGLACSRKARRPVGLEQKAVGETGGFQCGQGQTVEA